MAGPPRAAKVRKYRCVCALTHRVRSRVSGFSVTKLSSSYSTTSKDVLPAGKTSFPPEEPVTNRLDVVRIPGQEEPARQVGGAMHLGELLERRRVILLGLQSDRIREEVFTHPIFQSLVDLDQF